MTTDPILIAGVGKRAGFPIAKAFMQRGMPSNRYVPYSDKALSKSLMQREGGLDEYSPLMAVVT